ncbi:hypothetical protein AAFF_G00378830 [Aldrovandia affinis]|uniref:Fibronectin type-III domain-containing protein n=1 Tax=Aldrovandia affinis TaxID=143900 RepID=A0AAD7SFE8_9TELE|nr:hypothetical protein AAFF_G00378830 [Aldrovandia affinis]
MPWVVHVLLLVTVSGYECGWCLEPGKTPSIVELHPNNREQSLVVKWRANRDGFGESNATFEIHVGRTENLDIVQRTNVTVAFPSDDILLTWKWVSELPLQCIDHSVRIRCLLNDTFASDWTPWKMNLASKQEVAGRPWKRMFPYQQVLKEGSSAYFCCIPRRGTNITKMIFNSTYPSMIDIGDRVKAFVVENLIATPRYGVHFSCVDSQNMKKHCFNYVTFPPQRPQNLSCETRDLRTLNCSWKPGRLPNLRKLYKRNYTLFIQNSNNSISCKDSSSSCSFKAIPGQQVYNITVKVANNLGEVRESITFNITDRVFPVPVQLEVNPGVRNANVSWTLAGNLSGFGLLCQIRTDPFSAAVDVELLGRLDGRYESRVEGLRPCKRYPVTVRCAISGTVWRWGLWADSQFYTRPCVELDTWGQVRQHTQGRKVTVMWRMLSPQHCNGLDLNVSIQDYWIQWEQLTQHGAVSVSGVETQTELSIGSKASNITVTAVSQCGFSLPSTITILPAGNGVHLLKARRVNGSPTEGFQLSWAASTLITCGYTVEWCRLGSVPACSLQWKKVPVEFTTLLLPACSGRVSPLVVLHGPGDFRAGCRYTFNIFGCGTDGHQLLEKQTGYIEEQKPTKSPRLLDSIRSMHSSIILEWSFHEDDLTHTGFITGYLVIIEEMTPSTIPHSYEQSSYNLSVDDPHKKTLTIDALQEDREYTFHLGACTVVGVGPLADCTVRTPRNYSKFLVKVLIPTLLLFGLGFLLWLHRKMIMGPVLEVLKNPVALRIKALELDSSLYEASERIRALKVEECICCELELLEVKLAPDTKLQMDPKGCGCPCGDDDVTQGL